MLYLVLDTSFSHGFVALYESEKLLAAKTISSIELSSELMKAIESIFTENNKSIQHLDFIACGIGPGSFTGTRIGIVSVKAIAYSLNLPVVEFCSHIALIPNLDASEKKISIITDARSNQVYYTICTVENKEIAFEEPKIASTDVIGGLQNSYSPDSHILQNFSEVRFCSFNLDFLGIFTYKKYLNNEITTASDLKPIYLKSP